jgi:hypothetical protein
MIKIFNIQNFEFLIRLKSLTLKSIVYCIGKDIG